jgi:AbrB family looped-hinge helix DNA binding protein
MQIQTVFKAGNSNVVAIPKDISKKLGLKKGSKVVVEATPDNTIVVSKAESKKGMVVKDKMSGEFKKWLEKVLKEDKEILDELSVR